MSATALQHPASSSGDAVRRITTLLSGFSIAATRLSAADADTLKAALPPQTRIYLTAFAGRSHDELVEPAARLQAAGFEPVPHLAVRALLGADALDVLLSRLRAQAGVRRVLVIGGDHERAQGPFETAIEVIESGLLQRHGVTEVGIAGYPEGHPRITPDALDRTLAAKIEAAQQTGLAVEIVTQFSFDAAAVARWLGRLRDQGIEHPVRIGMTGPTNLSTLLGYAERCGVRASALGLARNAGLVKHLLGLNTPAAMIRPLAEACADGHLGRVAAHFFCFGGAGRAARWAAAAASGRITLDHAGGFGVEPP